DANPYPISYNSEEPLRLAIRNGHFDCARLLLENGADVNAHYFLGTEINLIPPNDAKFLKLLLMYGADANSYDRDGLTPLMKAARHRDGLESVQILVEYGALVNAFALERQDFRTPLHYAILSGNTKIVAYLIENGALVNMQW
uniref:Ankyrin n=1 Tax=Romanomermis culicivorax TaxID=13658 RepID=A0A915JJ09_ROMCU